MSGRRISYTAGFKRKVILVAEEVGNREAGRRFDVSEANIRGWRKKKESLQKEKPTAKASGRGRKAQHPELEKELVDIIAARRASGCAISTVEVRIIASQIMKKKDPHTNFKASACWCYKFMLRHHLSIRKRTSIAQRMPDDFEHKLLAYQKYVIKLRKKNNYSLRNIANADQTPLHFDLPSGHTIDFKGVKSVTIKSTGAEKARFTVKH